MTSFGFIAGSPSHTGGELGCTRELPEMVCLLLDTLGDGDADPISHLVQVSALFGDPRHMLGDELVGICRQPFQHQQDRLASS